MGISKWARFVDVLLLACFFIVAISGVVMLLGVDEILLFRVHIVLGILSILLVFVHVILHKREML